MMSLSSAIVHSWMKTVPSTTDTASCTAPPSAADTVHRPESSDWIALLHQPPYGFGRLPSPAWLDVTPCLLAADGVKVRVDLHGVAVPPRRGKLGPEPLTDADLARVTPIEKSAANVLPTKLGPK
jgi:hypothetical protein